MGFIIQFGGARVLHIWKEAKSARPIDLWRGIDDLPLFRFQQRRSGPNRDSAYRCSLFLQALNKCMNYENMNPVI